MKILHISSKNRNEAIYPDPEWRTQFRAQYCCKTCGTIEPKYVDADPKVRLKCDSEFWPLCGPIVPIMRAGFQLVRTDVAQALSLVASGFALYDAYIDGEPLAKYHLFSRPMVARLVEFTRRVSGFKFCSACGRPLMGVDGNDVSCIWAPSLRDISQADPTVWKDRSVYTGFAGTGFFVTDLGLARIPPSIIDELEIVECPIVDGTDCK